MNIISHILVILALLIIIIVMLQSKGSGLSIIPGTGDFGKFERRGPEKILHQATIGLMAVFIILCIAVYCIA